MPELNKTKIIRAGFILLIVLMHYPAYSQNTINNLVLQDNTAIVENGVLGEIKEHGYGKIPVILIADLGFSWKDIYAEFIEKNKSKYTMYAITLPGSAATSPPAMPVAGTSYGSKTWLKNAEQTIINLIDSLQLKKPVIIGNMVIASWLAMNMAINHPDKTRRVVIISGMPFATWPSPRDTSAKTPVSLEERAPGIDYYMAPVVYKTMSKKDWESNLYQPVQYCIDSAKAERFFLSVASTPVPVMVRYLCEFYTTDISLDFGKVIVPVLVLIPGFSDEYFNKYPGYRDKEYLWNGWDKAKQNSHFEIVTISGARLFILEDQLKRVSQYINQFIK